MMEFVSWDDEIPHGKIKNIIPNHQPVMDRWIIWMVIIHPYSWGEFHILPSIWKCDGDNMEDIWRII
jgi:hypothetical protein